MLAPSVSAQPTPGEGMGGGGPLLLGGSGGPPPGNFENLSSIWCPLVQSGDSFNAVNIH